MIYFDNAATGGKKPDSVLAAVNATLKQCANPGRSGHKLSLSCAYVVQNARNALSDFFDGYGYERVAFTKNCTEGLNLAIFSALRQGDHAVTTCMEHNSVLRPLHHLKTLSKIDYSVAPLNEENTVDAQSIATLIQPNTKAVIVTSASNVTGATPNLLAIRKAIPKNVLFIVDGAQGGGHLPLSMQKLNIDALSVAGHKGLHAIQGASALLFSPRFDVQPITFGGTGSESFNLGMPPFYPDKLESGTLNFPAITSLFEGTLYAKLKMQADSEVIYLLNQRLHEGLACNPKITLYSRPNVCGICAFNHKDVQAEEVANVLSEKYSIAVRGGLHCAPLMHEALKTADGGIVRASLSAFNTQNEVTALVKAMRKL